MIAKTMIRRCIWDVACYS